MHIKDPTPEPTSSSTTSRRRSKSPDKKRKLSPDRGTDRGDRDRGGGDRKKAVIYNIKYYDR